MQSTLLVRPMIWITLKITDRQILTYQRAKGLIVEMLAVHEQTHRDENVQEVLYPHPKRGGKPNKQLTDFTGTTLGTNVALHSHGSRSSKVGYIEAD